MISFDIVGELFSALQERDRKQNIFCESMQRRMK